MSLKPLALGLTMGIFWAVSILLITLGNIQFGIWNEVVDLIGSFYLVYNTGFYGTVLGILLGMLDGFICGYLIAWIYNKVS